MHGLVKKSIVIFISLVFLTSGLAVSSAVTIQKNRANLPGETLAETTISTKTVTLYRYQIDGSITLVQADIALEDGQDIGEAIADKCSELMENDVELQKFLQDYINDNRESRRTFGVLSKIKSSGRGLHFKVNILFRLRGSQLRRIKLFPLLPPYFRPPIIIPTIFCRYPRDDKANTTIMPLIRGENATKTYEGPHRVLAVGFIGYKGWLGHVSFLGFGMRTGFAGYAMFASCNELKL